MAYIFQSNPSAAGVYMAMEDEDVLRAWIRQTLGRHRGDLT